MIKVKAITQIAGTIVMISMLITGMLYKIDNMHSAQCQNQIILHHKANFYNPGNTLWSNGISLYFPIIA